MSRMNERELIVMAQATLSRGAREMAKRGVIVARLEALENLGSIDVLCTDKTGTLTLGVVGLERRAGRGRPRLRRRCCSWPG